LFSVRSKLIGRGNQRNSNITIHPKTVGKNSEKRKGVHFRAAETTVDGLLPANKGGMTSPTFV